MHRDAGVGRDVIRHTGDWRGGTDFADGDVIAAATRALYDEAVALLA